MAAVATLASHLTLGSHHTQETSNGDGTDVRFNQNGRHRQPTCRRVGETTESFLQDRGRKARVVTDDAEILGYVLFNDLAGCRIGYPQGRGRSGYGQQRKTVWVIDHIAKKDVKEIQYLG